MKTFCVTAIAIVILLTGTDKSQAQSTQAKLNQVELFKLFKGDWQAQWADTILFWEAKPFGSGLEGTYNYKIAGKDKIILEGRQLWGYDSRLDKYVVATLETGKDIWLLAFWFTSKDTYLLTSLADVSNADKAFFKVEGVINSADSFTETWIMNDKVVVKYEYKRVK